MDTFVFGPKTILSACLESNTQLKSVGKVIFCFGKHRFSFPPVFGGLSAANISSSAHPKYVVTRGFPHINGV